MSVSADEPVRKKRVRKSTDWQKNDDGTVNAAPEDEWGAARSFCLHFDCSAHHKATTFEWIPTPAYSSGQ